jgi:hypothetical protein
LIGWLIIFCEIGFWVFVLAGLLVRYILKKKKLGTLLLICTPFVDIILLIATVLDLKNGANATTVHGLSAILYRGKCSVWASDDQMGGCAFRL